MLLPAKDCRLCHLPNQQMKPVLRVHSLSSSCALQSLERVTSFQEFARDIYGQLSRI